MPIEIRHAGYPEIWRTLDILPRHLGLQQDMKCPFILSHCVANHRHLPNVIQHFWGRWLTFRRMIGTDDPFGNQKRPVPARSLALQVSTFIIIIIIIIIIRDPRQAGSLRCNFKPCQGCNTLQKKLYSNSFSPFCYHSYISHHTYKISNGS